MEVQSVELLLCFSFHCCYGGFDKEGNLFCLEDQVSAFPLEWMLRGEREREGVCVCVYI